MDAVALVGALGIGSAVGTTVGTVATTFLTGGKARREARSAVIKHLSETENARWISDPKSMDDAAGNAYKTALRQLETAALIARLPRDVVQHYIIYAQAARWASMTYAQSGRDKDGRGFVDTELTDIVYEAVAELNESIWHPVASRWKRKNRVNRRKIKALKSDSSDIATHLPTAARVNGQKWEVSPPLVEQTD